VSSSPVEKKNGLSRPRRTFVPCVWCARAVARPHVTRAGRVCAHPPREEAERVEGAHQQERGVVGALRCGAGGIGQESRSGDDRSGAQARAMTSDFEGCVEAEL